MNSSLSSVQKGMVMLLVFIISLVFGWYATLAVQRFLIQSQAPSSVDNLNI